MCSPAPRMTMVAGALWAFSAPAAAQTKPVVLLADDFATYPVLTHTFSDTRRQGPLAGGDGFQPAPATQWLFTLGGNSLKNGGTFRACLESNALGPGRESYVCKRRSESVAQIG